MTLDSNLQVRLLIKLKHTMPEEMHCAVFHLNQFDVCGKSFWALVHDCISPKKYCM